MKIVIAPDSFKGSLSALQVARAMEKGIHRVLPKAKCLLIPMADGGEGTVRSMLDAMGGKSIRKTVKGPIGNKVRASYGLLADKQTAVIEMAEASGLPLVPAAKRNPMQASSYGTGELIADALDRHVSKIIVGIGGSATNDAGAGMAQALGARFLDRRGRELTDAASGGMLNRIAGINVDDIHPGLKSCKIVVASDVDNPLCGKHGASYIFGPQKGATPAMVRQLDANLACFAGLIRQQLGLNVKTMRGAGAAGGLGAGLVAFAGAKLQSGIDIVIQATDLRAHVKSADLVFTGEGRVDLQTAFGKTPAGVAKLAKRCRVPVVAIGGGLSDDARGVFKHGIDALDSAIARDMSLEEALENSRLYIANAAERTMRLILVGRKIGSR